MLGAEEFPARGKCAIDIQLNGEALDSILTCFCNTHGYARDPPDDGDVARIADPPSVSMGMRGRNQNQLAAIQFAPTADIAIAQLEEKDWTVKARHANSREGWFFVENRSERKNRAE